MIVAIHNAYTTTRVISEESLSVLQFFIIITRIIKTKKGIMLNTISNLPVCSFVFELLKMLCNFILLQLDGLSYDHQLLIECISARLRIVPCFTGHSEALVVSCSSGHHAGERGERDILRTVPVRANSYGWMVPELFFSGRGCMVRAVTAAG